MPLWVGDQVVIKLPDPINTVCRGTFEFWLTGSYPAARIKIYSKDSGRKQKLNRLPIIYEAFMDVPAAWITKIEKQEPKHVPVEEVIEAATKPRVAKAKARRTRTKAD